MQTEIGPTLREARIRRKIDLTQIEERTKIRVRYLRALENDEWDLLPGPTYTRSFIRTYANFLGLDGERLADDFRRLQESQPPEPGGPREPQVLPGLPRAEGRQRFGAGFTGAVIAALLIAGLFVLGVVLGDGDGEPDAPPAAVTEQTTTQGGEGQGASRPRGVSIRLTATAEVWVCAVAADGTPVVNGQILAAGAQQGPFRSGRFDLAFGNGSVDLRVDGKPFEVEPTPSPVGYRVTPQRVSELAEGTRPDCT